MSADDLAPNFKRNYPMAGERIGPAWQLAWDTMADGDWHKGIDLAEEIAAMCELSPVTVQNLLREATKVELIEVERRFAGRVGGRGPAIRPAWYRRTP